MEAIKPLPKTTIKKWLSLYLQDMGYRQGYTYYLNITNTNDPWYYNFNKLPNLFSGQHIRLSVCTNKDKYELNNFSLQIPSLEEIRAKILFSKNDPIPQRDYQRSKVYRAEKRMLYFFEYNGERLSESEISTLSSQVCSQYNIIPPKIRIAAGKKTRCTSYGYLREIKLAKGWGQDKMVVLHELAHQIVWQRDYSVKGHGEYFVSIMACLYAQYLKWDMKEMRRILNTYKVKYVPELTVFALDISYDFE